eukprot:TRINITY_DN54933_c0_g1_i1.p1 TRINITY_DN54933_c0_g1~~TRINITY_DN54933_c0_g1_i1.p1  ORF type:complete len:208 (-),score=43.07 TRINITY_DN54933_c0_g1_i1:89-712(-)
MEASSLSRASTQEIREGIKAGGMLVLGLGLCVVMSMTAVSVIYISYSMTLPRECPLRTYFLVCGILCGVMMVLMALNVFFIKGMTVASSHMLLAAKYEQQHRDAEAQQEKEAFGSDMAPYVAGMACVSCPMLLLSLFSFGWKIYGIVLAIQASHKDAPDCGSALTVFWTMLIFETIFQCINSCNSRQGHSMNSNMQPADSGSGSGSD